MSNTIGDLSDWNKAYKRSALTRIVEGDDIASCQISALDWYLRVFKNIIIDHWYDEADRRRVWLHFDKEKAKLELSLMEL